MAQQIFQKWVILLLFGILKQGISTCYSQQTGTLQIEAGPHGNFFVESGDRGWGFGGSVKLLLPLATNENYISAGLIADRLQEDRYLSYIPEPVTLINATGGYRKMLRKFFIEPQLGIGFIIEKNRADTPWETDKTYALLNIFPGVESGMQLGSVTIAFSYRHNFRDPFKDIVYSIFSVKTAYRFGGR